MPVISYLPHLIQCLTKSCTINLEFQPSSIDRRFPKVERTRRTKDPRRRVPAARCPLGLEQQQVPQLESCRLECGEYDFRFHLKEGMAPPIGEIEYLDHFPLRFLLYDCRVSEVCSLRIPSRHIGVFIRWRVWRVWRVGAEGRAGFFCVMHWRCWPLAGPRGRRRPQPR